MNKQHEIGVIQSLLKIPVTDIVFTESNTVEIISGNKIIGSIPLTVNNGSIKYNSSPEILQGLNWVEIYNQWSEEITAEAKIPPPKDVFLAGFRDLYVKTADGSIITFTCVFDGKWSATLFYHQPKIKTKKKLSDDDKARRVYFDGRGSIRY